MRKYHKFYIGGEWVEPASLKTLDVLNPATEEVCGSVALGTAADVDRAVRAARTAFASWSQTSPQERLEVLERVAAEYQKRAADLATAVSEEMGRPPPRPHIAGADWRGPPCQCGRHSEGLRLRGTARPNHDR
ncbi:aldehyde dehydrogenase family protein [Deinococcus malanensis]|uniref:aldehyde dehydrogenase family protein n=1 Tax=Deinococcus malanensis TaxID=1706855 RepID=UPI00362BEB40